MAATRKLQAEIDRCLKKVAEGVDKFEETWQKVHNATNTNQKEKYEEDLKKEIKKLQRLRDQIKTWIASPDVKDKAVLMDKRKLIEQQMERFKVVERETKTKAYSKEGLTSGTKLDPAEKERYEISQWLNQQLHSLNLQIDQFEAEIESLAGAKKKKNKNSNEDKIEEYKTLLEKHRDHVQKLETLLRMLDNDTVDINQIKDIKEDVEYYIENCQEDDFTENEMIYEDIDGLEEMLLDLSNIGGLEHNTNSVDASETMSTNSASSPVPSAGPASTHNHSNDLTSATDEKRRHKSSSDDSKTPVVGNANNSTSTAGIPAAKVQPNNASKPNAVNSLSSSSAVTAPLAAAPKSTTSTKSFTTPNNSSPSSGLPNHVPPPQSPAIVTQQQPNFAAAVAAQQNGHASSDHGVVRSSPTPPHVSHALPGTIPPSSQAFSALPPNQQSNNLPPISRPSASDSMSLKSLAQATLDQQLSQQPQQQTSQSQTSSQPPVGTAPSISQPGLFSTSGQKELKTDSSSAAVTAHIPPLLGVAPLGPVALNKDTQYQYTMLDAAYAHMPHPSDSEKLRPYLPRNPCPTPAYYPQLPPSGSDTIEFFQRLSTETLFFIFYYMEGTNAQFLAAKALKKQSWRFHTKYMMWFQRHEEPKIINDEYEQGTYIYFDFEKWGQRKKEGFTFEYRFLEDRELN